MRTSFTRVAAGIAIAAAAVLTVAGTASAATASPAAKAHTTLSIVESRTWIKAGQKDVISGDLRTGKVPVAGKVVVLDRIVGKKLIPVQFDLTGKAGRVHFVVRPKVTARYMLVFPGTKKLHATHSGVVTVVVKK